MIFGIVQTKGTKIVYTNRYEDAIDFGFNIPKIFGLYFWVEWYKKKKLTT